MNPSERISALRARNWLRARLLRAFQLFPLNNDTRLASPNMGRHIYCALPLYRESILVSLYVADSITRIVLAHKANTIGYLREIRE